MTGRIPVCVFAKPPRAGTAKTRLAESIGAVAAAALARAFFEDTWAMVTSLPWADPILATTEADAPEWSGINPRSIWPQGEGSLGDRMARVMARALTDAPSGIIIGSDIPGLPPSYLDATRAALRHVDAVLGPATDGGFYLLGMRRCPTGILDDVPWGAPNTLARTLHRFAAGGLTAQLARAWFDVDTPEDLALLRAFVESGLLKSPATVAALAGSAPV